MEWRIIGAFGLILFLIDYIELSPDFSERRNLRTTEDVTKQVAHQLVTRGETRQKKPVMYTFFEPVPGGCCGMTEKGHHNLVASWEEAWQAFGWETRVLNEKDARRHPFFEPLHEKLIEAGVNEYDQRCFWRWLAIASEANGGWMSDYDNFPLSFTADKALAWENDGGFKTWSWHVPAMVHANRKTYNQIVKKMVDLISPDLKKEMETTGYIMVSDMMMLKYLHDHYNDEMNVTLWANEVYGGFPYVKNKGNPKIDCNTAKRFVTAHLSHNRSTYAFKVQRFPKIEGFESMTVYDTAEKRADAARLMLKDYQNQCVAKH